MLEAFHYPFGQFRIRIFHCLGGNEEACLARVAGHDFQTVLVVLEQLFAERIGGAVFIDRFSHQFFTGLCGKFDFQTVFLAKIALKCFYPFKQKFVQGFPIMHEQVGQGLGWILYRFGSDFKIVDEGGGEFEFEIAESFFQYRPRAPVLSLAARRAICNMASSVMVKSML